MVARFVRDPTGELRRLEVRAAHDRVDDEDGEQPYGGGTAPKRTMSQNRRRQDPHGATQARPNRGSDRARAEALLWEPARRLHRHPPTQETRRTTEQGPHHRRRIPLPQRPGPELPRARAQRAEHLVVPRIRGRERSGQDGDPRRDREEGVDAQHLGLRAPGNWGGHATAPRRGGSVQDSARRRPRGRGSAAEGANRGKVAATSVQIFQRTLESLRRGRPACSGKCQGKPEKCQTTLHREKKPRAKWPQRYGAR